MVNAVGFSTLLALISLILAALLEEELPEHIWSRWFFGSLGMCIVGVVYLVVASLLGQ